MVTRLFQGLFLCIFCLLAGCGDAPVVEDIADKERPEGPPLVLLGIDSLGWEMIDPLIAAGEMPNMAALAERGVTAELSIVQPPFSPPNWTSIATGRSPEAHGVDGFFDNRLAIRVPTVFERLSAAGLKVGLYDYLITWPPRPLPGGFMIPGWLRLDDRVEPADLAVRAGWPEGEKPFVHNVVDVGGLGPTAASIRAELKHKAGDFLRVANAFDLDVAAVNYYGVDVASHHFFHTLEPEAFDPPIPLEPEFENFLPQTLREFDRVVGEMAAAVGDRGHLVIVSDHGARSDPTPVRNWGYNTERFFELADVGEEDGFQELNSFIIISARVAPGSAEEREPAINKLVETVSGTQTLDGRNLFDVTVRRTPADDIDAMGRALKGLDEWQREALTTNLPAYAFIFISVRPEVVDSVWLAEGEGRMVKIGNQRLAINELIEPHDFTGIHTERALLLAAGPAIQAVDERQQASVLDVAPLLFYLAGQNIPDDLEGKVDTSWLAPDLLQRRPPKLVPAAEVPTLEASEAEDVGKSEELMERLRALGYVQ